MSPSSERPSFRHDSATSAHVEPQLGSSMNTPRLPLSKDEWLEEVEHAFEAAELDYSLLYRRFVGLSMDDPVWDATTFTKNRDRLLDGDIADAFFAEVLVAINDEGLMSDEHFTVDGTLLEAWAS